MTDLTTISSTRLALTSSETNTLTTLDADMTAVSAPTAMTQAAITGGESPTEAEFNALRTDVVNLRTTVAAILTALQAVG